MLTAILLIGVGEHITMTDDQLINFFEIHKAGWVNIRHVWTETVGDADLSFEDLLRLIKLKMEKDNEDTKGNSA